jgi:hypothetical protein
LRVATDVGVAAVLTDFFGTTDFFTTDFFVTVGVGTGASVSGSVTGERLTTRFLVGFVSPSGLARVGCAAIEDASDMKMTATRGAPPFLKQSNLRGIRSGRT